MRALTLHQPWAQLIAIGAKTIETRSWATAYRGPLAIHAGAKVPADFAASFGWIGRYNTGIYADTLVHAAQCDCDLDEENMGPRCGVASGAKPALFDGDANHAFALPFVTHLPTGVLVAVCDLIDVVPIVSPGDKNESGAVVVSGDGRHLTAVAGGTTVTINDQLPYGDYTPGRYAWILSNVMHVADPTPIRGRQGLWHLDLDEAA